MAGVALLLEGLALSVGLGLRAFIQLRRTGTSGIVRLRAPRSISEAGVILLFGAAAGLLLAGPLLSYRRAVAPLAAFDHGLVHAIGVGLYVGGLAFLFYAQLAMGSSWRVGVDPSDPTPLVTDGPFQWTRNPIYSGTLALVLGLAFLAPSLLTFAGWVALCAGFSLQVRHVEEPYLAELHGAEFARYRAKVGRFVPRVRAGRA